MIAKINVGNSLYGALSYNQEKVNEKKGKVLYTNKIIENTEGNFNIHDCIECFNRHIPEGIRTKKNVIHISLNPDPRDNLSNEQLSMIAQEYMEKLGYGNQPYMVFKHEDIDRHHVHIVSIRTNKTGKKINDRFEYIRSQIITRELEQKYGLHPAAEKKQKSERPELHRVNYKTGDIKHQIANIVKVLVSSYHFQSFTEYKALLSIYNVQVEDVKGEINGKPYNGIVYSATNDKGEKQGNPFKSSSLGKSVGYAAIQHRIEKSNKFIKSDNIKEHLRNVISEILSNTRTQTLKKFEKELKKRGIDVLFRQNDNGRIYGVTFIDHNTRTVLNGSRLGKEFSANSFQERFNSKQLKQQENKLSLDIPMKFDITAGLFSSSSVQNPETLGNDIYSVDQRRRRRKKRKL